MSEPTKTWPTLDESVQQGDIRSQMRVLTWNEVEARFGTDLMAKMRRCFADVDQDVFEERLKAALRNPEIRQALREAMKDE